MRSSVYSNNGTRAPLQVGASMSADSNVCFSSPSTYSPNSGGLSRHLACVYTPCSSSAEAPTFFFLWYRKGEASGAACDMKHGRSTSHAFRSHCSHTVSVTAWQHHVVCACFQQQREVIMAANQSALKHQPQCLPDTGCTSPRRLCDWGYNAPCVTASRMSCLD